MKKSIEITKECIVPVNIETIWNLITSPPKFHGLGFPGSYSEKLDRKSAKKGTEIKSSSLSPFSSGKKSTYIVDWNDPYLFSFGSNATEWTYKFRLNQLEEHKTKVVFTRSFRKKSFLERIFNNDGIYTDEYFVSNTISIIKKACLKLSKGKTDGIFTE